VLIFWDRKELKMDKEKTDWAGFAAIGSFIALCVSFAAGYKVIAAIFLVILGAICL